MTSKWSQTKPIQRMQTCGSFWGADLTRFHRQSGETDNLIKCCTDQHSVQQWALVAQSMREFEKMLVKMQTVFCTLIHIYCLFWKTKNSTLLAIIEYRANIVHISIADVRQNTEPRQNTVRASIDKIQTEQVRTRIQVWTSETEYSDNFVQPSAGRLGTLS